MEGGEQPMRLGGAGGGNPEEEKKEIERRQREDDLKNNILSQVLEQNAIARLNSIALVKPEKAEMVKAMLVQMTRRGQIQSKLSETQLKGLLEEVTEKTQKTSKVKFQRRRMDDDDSDEY